MDNVQISIGNNGVADFRTIDEVHALAKSLITAICPDHPHVVAGLVELMINAVEHGNLGITYGEKTELNQAEQWDAEIEKRLNLPENQKKSANIHWERNSEEVVFTICDQGDGFEWHIYMDAEQKRIHDLHGRGITMARAMSFTHLEYQGCGNIVRAVVKLETTPLIKKF
jgi:hypothetical protein